MGYNRKAKGLYEESLALFKNRCCNKIKGFVLGGLAEVCTELGEIPWAIEFAERDLRNVDDSRKLQAQGMARLNLGLALAFGDSNRLGEARVAVAGSD